MVYPKIYSKSLCGQASMTVTLYTVISLCSWFNFISLHGIGMLGMHFDNSKSLPDAADCIGFI